MPTKTVPLYRPGQDMTGYCTTDVQAHRLAFFAAPPEGGDHPINVRNTRGADGDVPAGVVGFSQKEGGTVHIGASGVQPIESSSEAAPGNPAYADENGRVTTDSAAGANAPVGVFTAAAQSGQSVRVKLNLS